MRTALACLAIITALCVAQATACADVPPMPARMTSCAVLPQTMDRRVTPPEAVRVWFMITSDVPADLVRFTTTAPGGGFVVFSAHGYFTKSVMIAGRELHPDTTAPVHPLPPNTDCALTYIHFVNGTSWSISDTAAPR
jgi:hypothetical protein